MPESVNTTLVRRHMRLEKQVARQGARQSGYTMADALGTLQGFPMLRALWALSSVNESGNVFDISGQGRTLTNNNSAPFGMGNNIVPRVAFNGSNQFLSRADEAGLDITGALTIGGWFQFNALGTAMSCAGKWLTTGDQRSYLLQKGPANNPEFFVSGDGAASVGVGVYGVGINTSDFVFMAARFTPSTEIAVWGNNQKNVVTTGVPASLFNGTAGFNIGANNNGAAQLLNGRAALACFLCAATIPDSLIKRFYTISRTLFGV
jgi:hypothetical protein